jgi:Secretion system C-terminal sorting domain/Fibronectin type III domain/Bacterial pre-peptidase C-terminal domain
MLYINCTIFKFLNHTKFNVHMKLIALILLVTTSYFVNAQKGGNGGGGTQCSTPTGLSTSSITSSSSIANWNAVSGAISYDVDYKQSSSTSWITIAFGTTGTSWSLLGMPASTSFDWRVRANCSSGSSSYAQTTFSTLAESGGGSCSAPTGLSTNGITGTTATATWAPVSGAVSYNVDYKLASSADWITIANGTTSLQWTLGGMEPTTSYDWRVRANCSSGSSSYTQTQFTTQAIGSCSAPGGLFASNITSSTATLNWNAVTGAFAYTVEYKPVSSGSWIVATSGTYGLSVNLYALSSNTTYDWRVYSNCGITETSGYSFGQFTSSGSTPPPPPSSCPGPYDVSTNGTISGAASISLNTDIKGTIAPVNDIDHYKFTISSYGTINVWLTTLPGNYDLAVLNSSGTQIGISKNKGTRNENVSLSVTPGTYYAKVYATGSANNATSCYTLKVQTITATRAITTSTPVTASAAMENVNPNFTINIFPNPAGDQLNVLMEGVANKTEIKVYNLMGKLVMQQESNNRLTAINVSKLTAGFYLVHVNDGKETKTAKFVKN